MNAVKQNKLRSEIADGISVERTKYRKSLSVSILINNRVNQKWMFDMSRENSETVSYYWYNYVINEATQHVANVKHDIPLFLLDVKDPQSMIENVLIHV